MVSRTSFAGWSSSTSPRSSTEDKPDEVRPWQEMRGAVSVALF